MNTKLTFHICAAVFILGLIVVGCKKDFLDQKPDKSLLIPSTTADLQALLDNTSVFNQSVGLTSVADGDFAATEAGWNNYGTLQERNTYTWSAELYGTEPGFDWNAMYQQVFYANVVLDGLGKLGDKAENKELRGQALFHRAFAFYNLSQMFAAPYKGATAATGLGIPLKLTPVVTEQAGRGTIAETYAQVIADLGGARATLPLTVSYKSRPSRAAVYALLARVYLSMEDYPLAGKYADSCLQLRHELIDYNSLNTSALRPFVPALPSGNTEVIFYAIALPFTYTVSSSPSYVVPELYNKFENNDLRKVAFYRQLTPGNFKFKGSYAGSSSCFSGLAVDEMYLIRAEAAARAGKAEAAVADLNTLLVTRWKPGTYTPLSAADADGALRLVLNERRKELTMRGIRWSDLRRLNTDPRFAVTLSRTLNGQVYTLAPESKRYLFPLPPDEIKLNPMPQNER